MGIVLAILKIIGIVLCILLLLFLFLLFLVLFVPVRYQADVRFGGEVDVKASVSFLLRFVYLGAGLKGKDKYGKLRILGILVMDFFPSEEKKRKKEERARRKRRKKSQKAGKRKTGKKKTGKPVKKKTGGSASAGLTQVKNGTEGIDPAAANHSKNETEGLMPASADRAENERADSEGGQHGDGEPADLAGTQTGDTKKGRTLFSITRLVEKIRDFWQKLRLFLQKMIDKARNIKYTMNSVAEKLRNTRDTFRWYVELFDKEESRRALRKGTRHLKSLYHALKPRKFEGMLQFGMDDPGLTGDIFSKVCMLYPVYAGHVIVVPDFEHQILKGNLLIRGRVRIAVILFIAWKIVFDRDVRKLYKTITGGAKHE